MRARTAALVVVAALALGVAACGDDDDERAATTDAPAAQATTTAAGGETVEAAGLQISTDLSSKPVIPKPTGEPPDELVSADVVEGSGRAAREGDQIVVHYVGVSHASGEQFDASWDGGSPFNFKLGAGNVIPGWDRGIEGMRIGGRRVLVIPPELAYGETGQGPIGPDETLVFVVDMLNATPAGG